MKAAKKDLFIQAELNAAWMEYVRDTGGIIEEFPEEIAAMLRTTFESGYAHGASNTYRTLGAVVVRAQN